MRFRFQSVNPLLLPNPALGPVVPGLGFVPNNLQQLIALDQISKANYAAAFAGQYAAPTAILSAATGKPVKVLVYRTRQSICPYSSFA